MTCLEAMSSAEIAAMPETGVDRVVGGLHLKLVERGTAYSSRSAR